MRAGRRPPRLGRALAPLVLVGALAAGPALASPALAAPNPTRPRAALCTRVQRQYTRLARANARAKAAFTKAEALRTQLVQAGRTLLARRLDVRIAYLRSLHSAYAAGVAAVTARAAGRCSGVSPPQLPGF